MQLSSTGAKTNYQKNGGDFIGKKWCYLSNIVENYHETRVNYQTKRESNIGIQTWWGKFPVEVLTGKHRREWSMFDLWCVWLQEVLVRIQWECGVPPSSILQGFSQQNVRLSTSFNRQTYEEIGDVTSKVFHGFSFLKHQIWPAGELSRSPGDFAIKLWGIIKHGCWAGCWGNPSEKPREKKSYVDSSWTQASHDLAMEYEGFYHQTWNRMDDMDEEPIKY